jgi:hypothetical protein
MVGIFLKEVQRGNQNLLLHEKTHWQQYQREGFWKFLFGYAKEATQNGYDENKYEIEARIGEDEYCKHHYTECVRTGKSKTVFNPTFRK